MALLHYASLGLHDPLRTMREAGWSLGEFYQYLDRTIKHLEGANVVPRLAWTRVQQTNGSRSGFWVELREPHDKPEEPQRTFDAFLDDDVAEVFERPTPDRHDGRADRVSFAKEFSIRIREREPDKNRLLLEREPRYPELCLRPSTGSLKFQRAAVQQLQDRPAPVHSPLLRLFESRRFSRWPRLQDAAPIEWKVLTEAGRPGTNSQRAFVDISLRTPDFAILEGPPGSGKTTAICELILQLTARGARVLLCASTHVAVDNVLERLIPEVEASGSDLLPVRVGERHRISEKVVDFQLERVVERERKRLLKFLTSQPSRSPAQEYLLASVRRPLSEDREDVVERLILDTANVVCGTTVGILRHPDIRSATSRGDSSRARGDTAGHFDVLILDEASKTPFQEFLVPALLARRWIIVGDVRQLSPFVDEVAVAANLTAQVPSRDARNACVDVFFSLRKDSQRRAALVVTRESTTVAAYRREAEARNAIVATSVESAGLADVVIGSAEALAAVSDKLPADIGTIRGYLDDQSARRASAYRGAVGIRENDPPLWEAELGWRLCRHYELRRTPDTPTARSLAADVEALIPAGEDRFRRGVESVKRIAFPSILESLQHGFGARQGQRDETALSHGLPSPVLSERHARLEYQHRMHPDISVFSRTHVYANAALLDPPEILERRAWRYDAYQRRAVWIPVNKGQCLPGNRNPAEVDVVIRCLERFWTWARRDPGRPSEGTHVPWEVAVLTFYRGQERELRSALRKLTRSRDGYRHFVLTSGNRVDARVVLCTVDSFQGHEADLVLLSIANTHPTNFLQSANRLNVALTRARYQRVIVGHHRAFLRAKASLLQTLAHDEPSSFEF